MAVVLLIHVTWSREEMTDISYHITVMADFWNCHLCLSLTSKLLDIVI